MAHSTGFNSVLIDFRTIIDLKIGAIMYIGDKFYNSNLVNKWYLSQPIEYYKYDHVFNTDIDIFERCFIGDARDSYKSLYNEVMLDHYYEVIMSSPYTTVANLIRAFTVGDLFEVTVLCNEDYELRSLKANFSSIKRGRAKSIVIPYNKRKDIDLAPYSRIYLNDQIDALDFGEAELREFAFMAYGDNRIITDDGLDCIHRDVLMKYGDINKFVFINPYTEEELPKG
jgi:hypothetical protein